MRSSSDKPIVCQKCEIPMRSQGIENVEVAGRTVEVEMFHCENCRRWHAEAIGEAL